MTRAKLLAIGGLVVVILAVIGVQHFRIQLAQGRAEMAEAALTSCKRDRLTLVQSIEDQNAAIAALQAASEAQAQKVAVAAQEAAQARRDADARVRRTLAAVVPQECTAAVRWGAEQAVELAEGWM